MAALDAPMADAASQPFSHQVLRDKYAQPGERTPDDVRQRVARALAEAEPPAQRAAWAARFVQAQREGFIPAGRIAANAGTGSRGTLVNCFVQPLADSVSHADGARPPIFTALAETAETLRLGGGVGLDFSPIRPRGALVHGTAAPAAGPLAFVRLFEVASQAIAAPARRSALMGVLRCDHPDVEEFVAAKARGGLDCFNLSVAVTDAFMHALESGGTVALRHAAEPSAAQRAAGAARASDGQWVYRRVSAAALWHAIVTQAHARGEPGVIFIDRINGDNNLAYCETLSATNPCGEQPLPPYGACCLGSIDLTRCVRDPFGDAPTFDFARLDRIVPVAVRMLDDALEVTAWPLPQQQAEGHAKRRIGLGFTGLADALVMLGLRYDSPLARELAARISRHLRDGAYAASVALARERGAFPAFDAAALLRPGGFAGRLPTDLQEAIRRDGLRNSHLLSIAPTGSVSIAFADNASTGIEPAFCWHGLRHRRLKDGSVCAFDVEDHALRVYRRLAGPHAPLTPAFVDAQSLAVHDHLAMVAAVAPFVDGAISKTVNAPAGCGVEGFDALYRDAWRAGLKGVTGFRPEAAAAAVLRRSRTALAAA